MKSFIKKTLIFSVPLLIYVVLALYVDPYNIIFNETNPKFDKLEAEISNSFNYPLYRLEKYTDNPTDIILLGDSRTTNLRTKQFDSLTGLKSTNLAYGGATLPEIIKTFWYVSELHPLKEVYLGVNFNLFNEKNNMDRVTEAIALKDAPFSYLFSQYCLKSTSLILRSLGATEKINMETPKGTVDEFWQYQLESSAPNFYRQYIYPNGYLNELKEISKYCKDKGIKLVIFVPPTHTDLQNKVKEFNLVDEEIKVKSEISKLGIYYDFDYPCELTKDKNNFWDPFHFNHFLADFVTEEIVTGKIKYSRTNAN